MVRFGVPGQNVNSLSYADERLSVVPVVQAPRRPTTTDKKFPMWCEWRTNKNSQSPTEEGEFWKLIRFESNGDATWVRVDLGGTAAGIDYIETDDGAPAVPPDGTGTIIIGGGTGIITSGQDPSTTVTVSLDTSVVTTQYDGDSGSATPTLGVLNVSGGAGIVTSAAGNTVTIALTGGGAVIDSIMVDAISGTGVNPVIPDGAGLITVTGGQVGPGVVGPNCIRTESLLPNSYEVQVQRTDTAAASDVSLNGVSHFDSNVFTSDVDGFVSLNTNIINLPVGTTINLGINYSSPTFTLTSSDGTALSASNPGYVVLPSNVSPGYKVILPVIADISFDDDSGTSDLTGNTWGTDTTVAWSNAMPFYIYGVADSADANATFMITRVPHLHTSPAAGNIAKSGSAVATTEGSFFAIDSAVTVANYATKSCARVGAFRMAKNDAANDDWTVEAMNATDGIGETMEGLFFTFPQNQNGAVSDCLSSSTGGDTIPTGGGGFNYSLDVSGLCHFVWSTGSFTAGVGTGDIRLHLPLRIAYDSTSYSPPSGGRAKNNGAGTYTTYQVHTNVTSSTYVNIYTSGVGVARMTPADFTTDLQDFGIGISYMVTRG